MSDCSCVLDDHAHVAVLPEDLFYHMFVGSKAALEGQWEWRDDGNVWRPYSRRDSARLEAALQVVLPFSVVV